MKDGEKKNHGGIVSAENNSAKNIANIEDNNNNGHVEDNKDHCVRDYYEDTPKNSNTK